MVDPTPEGETVADIARRTGRPLTTVRNTWTRHPDWPPSIGKRGRWNTYDPRDVDAWLREQRPTGDLEPARLYTAQEIADAVGLSAGTIRSDLSRGRWPKPDDTTDNVNRWYGQTATNAFAKRQRHRRTA